MGAVGLEGGEVGGLHLCGTRLMDFVGVVEKVGFFF